MKLARALSSVALLLLVLGLTAPASLVSAQRTGASITVELQEFENSGVTGTAVITENPDGGVHVSMVLVGQELDGNHPTHIHTGTCQDFDPDPLYPLETVNLSPVNAEGVSESDIPDVSLAELQEGEYVILVHQSPEELTNYLICGEIGSGTPVAATPEAVGGAAQVPASGVGFGLGDDDSQSAWIVALSATALVSVAAGFLLSRRPNRG